MCPLSLIVRPDVASGVFGPANMEIGDGGIPVAAKPSLMIPVVAIFQRESLCSLAKSISLQISQFLNLQLDDFMWFCYTGTQFNYARRETMAKDDMLVWKTAQTKIPTPNFTDKTRFSPPYQHEINLSQTEPCRRGELALCLPLQAPPKV